MHSRKSHKLHDGFFERHRNHPYQNNSKYKSAKRKYRSYDKCENGTTSDNESSDSDSSTSSTSSTSTSSSSNQDHYRRSSSHHNSFNRNNCFDDTVNDRYHSKVSYLQKMRDKERDYRDFKIPSGSSSSSFSRDRDNRDYRDRDRDRYSPKDRRNREHRTNHDRLSIDPDSNTKSNYVRDKKTYNSSNDKDVERDINKLMKVGDWSEHISSSGKKYYFNCKTETSQWEKPREWIEQEKNRTKVRERDRSRSPLQQPDLNQSEKHSSCRSTAVSLPSPTTSVTVTAITTTISNVSSWNDNSNSSQLTRNTSLDMDISPSPINNIPVSETVCNQHISPQPTEITTTNHKSVQVPATILTTPTSSTSTITTIVTTPGPVLIANALPRLIVSNQSGTATVDNSPVSRLMVSMVSDKSDTKSDKNPLEASTSNTGDATTTNLLNDSLDLSNTSVNLPHDPRKLTSPTTSHTTQSTVRSQGPILSPTLVNFYREDLTEHVRNVSVDDCDKEIEKYSEEASSLTNTLLRTSADLKKARSLVRCDEIKSTLQEQRILFLAQQIKTLEELKLHATILSDDK